MIAKGFTPEKGTKSFAIMGVPVLRGKGESVLARVWMAVLVGLAGEAAPEGARDKAEGQGEAR
jgi:hypothetical protein